jgi:Ca-activated chloride channel family protein
MKQLKSLAFSTLIAACPVAAQSPEPNPSALIVFDASGSMWGQIEGKAKIEIAREVVADLVRDLPSETELGLMAYGHRRKGDCTDIELLIPVGKVDKPAFIKTVEDIMPKGMTPITASLQLAAENMRYTEQKATVILVSDGLETCDADPCNAAKKLEEMGVDFTAHVIAFDLKPEETMKLECISKSTGGRFFPASDAESLKDALDFAIEEAAPAAEEPETAPDPQRTATITAPASAVAGSKIEVTWESEPMKGDYVTIARAGADDDKNFGFSYTYEKDSGTLTTMLEPGDAEVRYIAAKTGKVLARQAITLKPFEVTLEAPEEAVSGSEVSVEWTGPNYPGDFITVVTKGTADDQYAKYTYTREGSPLKVLTPPAPGEAEIRYMAGKGNRLLARIPLTLTKAAVTLEAPETAVAGATIPVKWSGPANKGDFITIVMKGTAEGKYAKYAWAREAGTADVIAPPTVGEAEIRYVAGQNKETLARIPLKLTAAKVSLEAPEEVVAGATVPVKWDGPANEGDFISIVMKDTAEGEYAKYAWAREAGTAKVIAPITAGEAEIRYIAGQGQKTLARRPIKLTEPVITLEAPSEAPAGSEVSIKWTGPANQGDFITIVPKDSEEGRYAKYAYARSKETVQIKAPLEAGPAEIRYLSGQGSKTLFSVPIQITAQADE